MFEEVRVCGLGSIDEAVLELHPRLTVLSGETGAGKSSVIRAFGLLAGARAEAASVRSGHACAAVEARIRVAPDGPLADRIRELGGEVEADGVLITRTVSADGRSRAFVGGRAVPVGVLSELVGGVLALHGQSSQLELRHPAAQRAALDRFIGPPVLAPLAAYRAARQTWTDRRAERERLRAAEAESGREIELLRLGLGDLERVAPLPAEDLDLERELRRLAAADELRSASLGARGALAGGDEAAGGRDDGGSLSGLVFAARSLDAAASSDPELGSLAARAHELCVLATDLAGDLGSYADGVEADGPRLAVAQERRAELTKLCRPHGTDVDGVLRWAADAEQRLMELDVTGCRAADLEAAEAAAAERMVTLAGEVSAARRVGAAAFAARVTGELAALSLGSARFEVAVESTDAAAGLDALGLDGADTVEFRFSSSGGMELRPLARAASGGELSRVVLALEVVLADGADTRALVFDEVDAGIGGEVATEVGRRLAQLAGHAQVICVTHLAQVAAYADQHLLVAKQTRAGAAVHSSVAPMDRPQRLRELSRMLGGVADSRLAQGHAAELLECAVRAKGDADGAADAAASPAAGSARSARRPARRSGETASGTRTSRAAPRRGSADRVIRGAA